MDSNDAVGAVREAETLLHQRAEYLAAWPEAKQIPTLRAQMELAALRTAQALECGFLSAYAVRRIRSALTFAEAWLEQQRQDGDADS